MLRLAACLFMAIVSCAVPLRGGDNVPPPGYQALFNGRDLAGWKGQVDPNKRKKLDAKGLVAAQKTADERMKTHWKVEQGVLVFDGKGDNLCSVEDYGDFEMLVDWKILKSGDSGIYLRGNPQVQIWDPDEPKYKTLGAPRGSGSLWNNSNKKNERWPLVRADKPIGEWNQFKITMVGEKVTVLLNDKLVVKETVMENFWEKGKPIPPTGSLELQNHGNTLYFKNIFVKRLGK